VPPGLAPGEFQRRAPGEFQRRAPGEFQRRAPGEFQRRAPGEFQRRGRPIAWRGPAAQVRYPVRMRAVRLLLT
jgi:hypothetical protein